MRDLKLRLAESGKRVDVGSFDAIESIDGLSAVVRQGVTATVAATVSDSRPTTEAKPFAVIALTFGSSSLPAPFSQHRSKPKSG